jgi:alanine-alpha-ketoisovalerate/valine-pyruvate aminotransferase
VGGFLGAKTGPNATDRRKLGSKHHVITDVNDAPFTNIIFTEAKPFWNKNTVVCMSLSKFGLPALRTGILVADEVKRVCNTA